MHASLRSRVFFVSEPHVHGCDDLKRNIRKSRAQLRGEAHETFPASAMMSKTLGHDTCVSALSSELVTSSESCAPAAEPFLPPMDLHFTSSCKPPQHDQ